MSLRGNGELGREGKEEDGDTDSTEEEADKGCESVMDSTGSWC